MSRKANLVLLLVILASLLIANVPAPWYPCEGKAVGDPCQYGYGCTAGQQCALAANSLDDPSTPINEQLQCR